MIRRLLALFRRSLAYIALRSTERRLHDAQAQYRHHSCPLASLAHDLEVERLSEELARRRAAYVAAYRKPGERITWEMA